MKKLLLILGIVPMLSSCASWEGRSEAELVGKFGIPTRQMELPEGTAFEYVECNSFGTATTLGNTVVGSSGSCSRKVFIVNNHRVIREFSKRWH